MSLSLLQELGQSMLANTLPDPAASGNGYIRVVDRGITVCTLTVAQNNRQIIGGATPGQILVLLNKSGSAISNITDAATNLALTLDANQAAICVATGDSTKPWAAVILLAGTVT